MDKKIDEALQEFNAILEFIIRSARSQEIHQVEESLHRMLLRLGKLLLEVFILAVGTGKLGEVLVTKEGEVYRYLRDSTRKYMSLFGEITISRAYYAKGGRQGFHPLDARLNLPRRKYSYPLQDRMTCGAVEEFMDSLAPPPASLQGPILVHTVDCKGIRMRPGERNSNQVKTEDLQKKALGYFRSNRDRMNYDRLLARRLPIASGVIESTCNSLINLRMEGPGMFWAVDGAEAILKLRGVFLDDLWEEFWAWRTKREKKRLYARYDNIRTIGQEEPPNRKAA